MLSEGTLHNPQWHAAPAAFSKHRKKEMDMSDSVDIYHNPRCSKSRATLELLESRGIEVSVIEYLKEPPDDIELRQLLDLLGISARELLRTSEAPYKELNLADPSKTEDEIIEAILKFPILMERPIVTTNSKARIGRPPEAVLEIL
jgi:arsenate reductase (glutaredoxin)